MLKLFVWRVSHADADHVAVLLEQEQKTLNKYNDTCIFYGHWHFNNKICFITKVT